MEEKHANINRDDSHAKRSRYIKSLIMEEKLRSSYLLMDGSKRLLWLLGNRENEVENGKEMAEQRENFVWEKREMKESIEKEREIRKMSGVYL